MDVVRELSHRTSLPEETVAAVLRGMHDLIQEGAVGAGAVDVAALLGMSPTPNAPPDDPGVVEQLIARAKKHPLGLEFLASGLLATVAITLGAHAFTVEAARRRLAQERKSDDRQRKDEDRT
jgi:hypothetical protein